MATTIIVPDNTMWAEAIKNLHKSGEINSKQMEACLNRLQQSEVNMEDDGESIFQSELDMFVCPVCNQTKFAWERDKIKRNWCRGCADEFIGEVM